MLLRVLEMSDLSALERRVMRYVPNCPRLMISTALSDASREFFGRSRCWIEEHMINVVTGTHTYVVDMGSAQWLSINWAKVDKFPAMEPVSISGPVDHSPVGRPNYYGSTEGETITLYPTPDKNYNLSLSAFCQNPIDGTVIPDGLFNRYAEPLVHGAAADLLNMKSYPWYAPENRRVHLDEFEAGIQQAHAAFLMGHTKAGVSVQMVPMA